MLPINEHVGESMDIYCQNCRKKVGQVADEKIPVGRRASVTCPQCGEKIYLTRPAPEAAPGISAGSAKPAEPAQPPPGVEIPGRTGSAKTGSAAGPGLTMPAAIPDYDFQIGAILKEAWQKTSGVKGSLWGAALIIILVVVAVGIVAETLGGLLGSRASIALSAAIQITLTVAIYPFMAGVMMIGVRRSVDLPVSWKLVFGYFSYLLPIVISTVLISILTTIGFFLLIIPGIYLSLAYMLVMPLIVDKNMGPWEAMEASRKAISKHWFKVFGLYFVMGLIYFISVIPFGIGLIWTLPMFVMVGGILYREIFGVSESV